MKPQARNDCVAKVDCAQPPTPTLDPAPECQALKNKEDAVLQMVLYSFIELAVDLQAELTAMHKKVNQMKQCKASHTLPQPNPLVPPHLYRGSRRSILSCWGGSRRRRSPSLSPSWKGWANTG